MRKPIKYGLLGLGGLLVLVIGAVAVFAMTFDPNRYKGQIEAAVKEKTGRTLKLAGNLEVAFWPSLGAKVGGVSLSEKGDAAEFLSLQSAHASVAVLPLLRGSVLVDGIRVDGLKAQVVKDKQGRFNFADLLEGGEKPAAPPPPDKKGGESGGAVGFDIASVRIERSSVAYRDLASGQEIALSDIDLSTGRIAQKADGKLKFSVQAKGRNPDLDAKVHLAGDYQVDLPAKSYSLSGVDGSVTGTVAKEQLEAKLTAPRISIAADSAKGDAVTLEAKLGARQVSLKLAGIEGSAKALSIPKLTGQVSMPMPDLPQKTLQASFDGSLKADLEKYPQLIVMRSLGKDYGACGLRLGLLATSNRAVLDEIRRFLPIWNISPLAEKFLRLCVDYRADYEKARLICIQETQLLVSRLSANPKLKVFDTFSNFVLFKILHERVTSVELRDHLLNEFGFYVRDCSRKAGLGDKFIRVGTNLPVENARLVQAIADYLGRK